MLLSHTYEKINRESCWAWMEQDFFYEIILTVKFFTSFAQKIICLITRKKTHWMSFRNRFLRLLLPHLLMVAHYAVVIILWETLKQRLITIVSNKLIFSILNKIIKLQFNARLWLESIKLWCESLTNFRSFFFFCCCLKWMSLLCDICSVKTRPRFCCVYFRVLRILSYFLPSS